MCRRLYSSLCSCRSRYYLRKRTKVRGRGGKRGIEAFLMGSSKIRCARWIRYEGMMDIQRIDKNQRQLRLLDVKTESPSSKKTR